MKMDKCLRLLSSVVKPTILFDCEEFPLYLKIWLVHDGGNSHTSSIVVEDRRMDLDVMFSLLVLFKMDFELNWVD